MAVAWVLHVLLYWICVMMGASMAAWVLICVEKFNHKKMLQQQEAKLSSPPRLHHPIHGNAWVPDGCVIMAKWSSLDRRISSETGTSLGMSACSAALNLSTIS